SKRAPLSSSEPSTDGVSIWMRLPDFASAWARVSGLGGAAAGAPGMPCGAFSCLAMAACLACSAFIWGAATKYCQPSMTMSDSTTAQIRLRLSVMESYFGGTGSRPDEPPSQVMGWQRESRLSVSHSPLTGPWMCNASRAYSEQVGSKRQTGGNMGEMKRR